MIQLSKYARLLLNEGMSISQATKIFADHGVANADTIDKTLLRQKWIELVKQYHSDVSLADPNILKDVNAAYDVLKNTPIPSTQTNTRRYSSDSSRSTPRHHSDPWQTDPRAVRDPEPKHTSVNFFKKKAWELSGKPTSIDSNKYTFWNWDGYYFGGVFTVYTTNNDDNWFEISKLLIDWNAFYESVAVFVAHENDDQNTIYLINHRGKKISPAVKYEHESFNKNPGNDRSFTDMLRKTL